MSDHEIVVVIREWISKADNDLTNASNTLKMGRRGPIDTVCFHAQQCVEKYLKALLVLRGIPFPRTHDIRTLLRLVPAGLRPNLELRAQGRLTEFATVTRYPGGYEPISLAEARSAVSIARSLRREVRKRLPPEALRRGRR